MKKGKRIRTLEQLAKAAAERRSVVGIPWRYRVPAAVLLNMQARYVYELLEKGIFINIPKKRIDLSKPPRAWTPYQKSLQQPILNLPYYPELP